MGCHNCSLEAASAVDLAKVVTVDEVLVIYVAVEGGIARGSWPLAVERSAAASRHGRYEIMCLNIDL